MYTVEQIKEAGADANIHAYYVDELIKSLDELLMEQKNSNEQQPMEQRPAAVIDKYVKQLSKMQVRLMFEGMKADDYNKVSGMIGDLKEFIVNCPYYGG